jgi:DNA-binding NtrC family response regulator
MKVEPRILVVEDEGRMRDLLVRAITSWGIPAAGAQSGEEALRLLAAQPREIILLDLNLPGMSGMEVFEKIREKWPQTQVIVLTGFGDLAAAKQAVHLDAVEFLTKPCHLGELERAIDRAQRRLETVEPKPLVQEPTAVVDAGTAATLDELERQHILAALSRNSGNRVATATELGISLRTLYYRLSEYQKQGFNVD